MGKEEAAKIYFSPSFIFWCLSFLREKKKLDSSCIFGEGDALLNDHKGEKEGECLYASSQARIKKV